MINILRHALSTAICLLITAGPIVAQTESSFAIKQGDRVVFYGDSITDQRMYSLLAEQYIVTRFPQLSVHFVHSGVGGDRVSGGYVGPINERLDRDVTAYKPSVVTIMLGMNDASYTPFDERIFQTYANGYKHLVDKLITDNPGVRLTLVKPSPFDDVTRPLSFPGGYNAVLLRYSDFIGTLATEKHCNVADLNTDVVGMLRKANAKDPKIAAKIIEDRVHPGWGGHLIMAQSLLLSWNAPALVSDVVIDATTRKSLTKNATLSALKREADGRISWTCLEKALPFPLTTLPGAKPQDPNDDAAPYHLALVSSDFVDRLDKEMLTVTHLPSPHYDLTIDGISIGTFTNAELSAGINLATLQTPMLKQARLVASLTEQRANLHNDRWRQYQVPFAKDAELAAFIPGVLTELDRLDNVLAAARYRVAQPKAHRYVLSVSTRKVP